MTKINIELKVIFVTKQKRYSPADANNLSWATGHAFRSNFAASVS